MLKFRILLLAASVVCAASAASAQTAGAQRTAPRRPPRRALAGTRRPSPGTVRGGPQAHGVVVSLQRRLQHRSAGEAAARRFGSARLPGRPLLRQAGRDVGHRSADLSLLHPAPVEPAVAGQVGPLQRRLRGPDPAATSRRSGARTSWTICPPRPWTTSSRTASSARSCSTTWRSGSGSRSSTTSASKKVEQSKIDEELKKKGIQIRLDSFIDQGLVRRVAGVVRDMYAEKGYEFAEVKPEIKEVARRTQDRQPDLQHHRRPEGQDPERRVSRQQGDHRQASSRRR